MKKFSVIAYYIAVLFIISVHFFYYPKWLQPGTISWDVSGYYMYLPALFVYHDITQFKFKDEITQKYQPSPDFQQAYPHSSGNYVLKYSCGQAIQYLPFFLLANTFASSLGYPKDGFSLPYQFAISFGSLVICFIGLWYLRKSLLLFFDEWLTGWGLLILVLGTNYLDYSAITGAMTHNFLFTLYAVLIYATIQFYKNPSFGNAAAIGICVGWAALTRPTELISMLIPLSWGIYSLSSIKERFTFFKAHFAKLLLAVVITGLIGSIQIIYWKLVTGDFLVYSYQDQGFSWLRPHFRQGLFSYRAGWLTYTPMMLFACGFYSLIQISKKNCLAAIAVFTDIHLYYFCLGYLVVRRQPRAKGDGAMLSNTTLSTRCFHSMDSKSKNNTIYLCHHKCNFYLPELMVDTSSAQRRHVCCGTDESGLFLEDLGPIQSRFSA